MPSAKRGNVPPRDVWFGRQTHIAAWKSKKVTTKLTEEEHDGTTVIRERERLAQELSIVFATEETGTLE
jgi:hypothetical protein